MLVDVSGLRMIACLEPLPPQNHGKLLFVLRQEDNRTDFSVCPFQLGDFSPVRLEREIIGVVIAEGHGCSIDINGELLHALNMSCIIQLHHIPDDCTIPRPGDLKRISQYGIAGLIMVKLPGLILEGVFDVDLPFPEKIGSAGTGHPEKMLVLGIIRGREALKELAIQLKVLLVVFGVNVGDLLQGGDQVNVFKFHLHHSNPISCDLVLAGAFFSGCDLAAALSWSRIEGFSCVFSCLTYSSVGVSSR